MHNPCEKCNGEGISTAHEAADPESVNTYTTCDGCGGTGDERSEMEWPSPFWILLLIPNFMLFWS